MFLGVRALEGFIEHRSLSVAQGFIEQRSPKSLSQVARGFIEQSLNRFIGSLCRAQVVDDMMPRGIVNLSQNADYTGGGGKHHVPALLRSSALYHQRFKRGLLGQEALQVQGLPALGEELGLPIRLPWRSALPLLSQAEMFSLAGNSIHTQLAGEFTLWALAAVVPRERYVPTSFWRPSASQSAESESGSDGDASE